METNKLDSFKRMTPVMREIVAFEEAESNRFRQDKSEALDERMLYSMARKYWNEDSPEMAKSLRYELQEGNMTIPFVIHYPENKKTHEPILYIHGGGFVVGSTATHEGIMRRLAKETGAAVVGIDYSLAPEVKFPIQLEECAALAKHLAKNGDRYGLGGDGISIAGDSAGAYLALAITIYMRDREDISWIRSLILYYGAFGLKDSMSMRLYGGSWDGLSLVELKKYSSIFTRVGDEDNPYRNLFLSDLTYGIPPCYIMACELDPLKDDSRLLHAILTEYGMDAFYREVPGVIHAFMHYAKKLPEATVILRESAEFYRNPEGFHTE
jgi:acetyl esterase